MEIAQRQSIVSAVEARIHSFEAAERDLDAERALAHFASLPEFHVYNDGQLLTYEQVAAGVRGGFSKVRAMETPFSNLRVSVLSSEHALVTASLRRTVTDTAVSANRTYHYVVITRIGLWSSSATSQVSATTPALCL